MLRRVTQERLFQYENFLISTLTFSAILKAYYITINSLPLCLILAVTF